MEDQPEAIDPGSNGGTPQPAAGPAGAAPKPEAGPAGAVPKPAAGPADVAPEPEADPEDAGPEDVDPEPEAGLERPATEPAAKPTRVQPLDPPMVPFAVAGMIAWAVVGLALLPFREQLAAHGNDSWLWICLAGFLIGIPGLLTMIRHDANRRHRHRRQAAHDTAEAGRQ